MAGKKTQNQRCSNESCGSPMGVVKEKLQEDIPGRGKDYWQKALKPGQRKKTRINI